jgi:hypothetical protein
VSRIRNTSEPTGREPSEQADVPDRVEKMARNCLETIPQRTHSGGETVTVILGANSRLRRAKIGREESIPCILRYLARTLDNPLGINYIARHRIPTLLNGTPLGINDLPELKCGRRALMLPPAWVPYLCEKAPLCQLRLKTTHPGAVQRNSMH